MAGGLKIVIVLSVFIAVTAIRDSLCCPLEEDTKALYKSGEILDQSAPITLAQIKARMKESGVFDWRDPALSERDRKELGKLFDAVEIMTTSRNRQPSTVQNIFSSLRLVERAVKKQMKEGQISEELAAKFHWDKITARHRRFMTPSPHS